MPFPWSHHPSQLDRIEGALNHIFPILKSIERHQAMADATLDDILAETSAEATADASISTLLAGIKTQLDQALSGATLSPAQQAKVNQIFANMQANTKVISDAVAANSATTTPAPAPTTTTVTPPADPTTPPPADSTSVPAPTPAS